MSDEKIAEIRARHEEGIRAGADEDRAYLLAEVERLHKAHHAACEGGDLLRAELMQAIGLLEARLDTAIRERDEARAEVERSHKAHEAACRGGEWLLAEKVSLRARMCGEISDLRAENERLIRERDEARAEVEKLTRERDEAWSKETDYGEGFEEGWAAAQKQAAAEVVRLRKEAWIGAALMLAGLAMILGLGLSLAWSYLP